MLREIHSGGQTGVDRAALDVAMELGLACGGWCPQGRLAEDGVIDARYPLRETPDADYGERTLRNVRDTDGTLVICRGTPTGGTAYTIRCAGRFGKPLQIVDLDRPADPAAVKQWIDGHRIEVLNVAGPRESTQPGIHARAASLLRQVLSSNQVSRPGEDA